MESEFKNIVVAIAKKRPFGDAELHGWSRRCPICKMGWNGDVGDDADTHLRDCLWYKSRVLLGLNKKGNK